MSTNLQLQGGRQRLNSNDIISTLPDDVLIGILSLLPIKNAVLTSRLSKRWKFLWSNLTQLNFDAIDPFDEKLLDSKRSKYVNQVNHVMQSYNRRPKVERLRICFDLNSFIKGVIDKWLQFGVNKKVELLEVDLRETRDTFRYSSDNYAFPSRLSCRNISHLFRSPSTSTTVVELVCLKRLILKKVNVSEEVLQEFLKKSPHLETLSIEGSGYLRHICVSGRELKLKHFEIVRCWLLESVYLADFDLLTFTYKGQDIDLHLTSLLKLKDANMGTQTAGLMNKVFGQISSCASSLQVLSLCIHCPKEIITLESFPELPNVKKLILTIGGLKDNCLLKLASMVNACPNLETLKIELIWFSSTESRKEPSLVSSVPSHRHKHLKLLEIICYYGRIDDFELPAYIIKRHGHSLKKIVINLCWKEGKEEAALSFAWQKLEPVIPQGVELVIV